MKSFEHQAMATQFLVTIAGETPDYAESAAMHCFQRLDELEQKLSRFVADSDISRINKLKAGEQLILDFETWQVMKQAIQVQQWTSGTFDIGVAEHMNIFRAGKEGILNEFEIARALERAQQEKQSASLYLDPDKPNFYCIEPGMKFDLGGIGKGYALDQLALLMEEMEIANYSLNAGDSTILTRGKPENGEYWEYTIASSTEQKKLQLSNIAVSASGTYHQGHHIFDPRTGTNQSVDQYSRIWVAAESAAYSDAFSTGLFLLSSAEIEELAELLTEITWVALSTGENLDFIKRNGLNFVNK